MHLDIVILKKEEDRFEGVTIDGPHIWSTRSVSMPFAHIRTHNVDGNIDAYLAR